MTLYAATIFLSAFLLAKRVVLTTRSYRPDALALRALLQVPHHVGLEVEGGSPEKFDALIQAEYKMLTQLIKARTLNVE